MKLYSLKLQNNYAEILRQGKKNLSKDEFIDVNRFRFDVDKVRKLSSILIIKYFAENEFGLDDYKVRKNEFGKPFFKGISDLNFNISHSGDRVVGIVSDTAIGIDVEMIKPMDNLIDLAKRFFSKKEFEYIYSIRDQTKQLAEFFAIWTKKESFVKAVGKGISLSLSSFDVPLLKEDNNTTCYDREYWTFTCLNDIDEGYKISICEMSNQISNLETVELTIEMLML